MATANDYARATAGLAGSTYDEDEEDPPVYFEQDPESDNIGDGVITRRSGKRAYVPLGQDEARRLHAEGKANIPALDPTAEERYADATSILAGQPAAKPSDKRLLVQNFDDPPGEIQTLEHDFDDPSGEIVPLAARTPGTNGDVIDLDAEEDEAPPPLLARPPEEAPTRGGGVEIPKSSRIAREHNNPGNLKFAGQAGAVRGEPASDGGYWARFETPEMGTAALRGQVDLDSRRGKTLAQFVSGYAPPESNDTQAYIDRAAKTLGVSPDTPLSKIDGGKVTEFVANQESSTRLSPQAAAPVGPGMARKTTESQQQTQSQQTGQTASVQMSRQGSAQPFAEFLRDQQNIRDAYGQSIGATDAGTAGIVSAIRDNRAAMMQDALDREAATSAAIAQRDARANTVKQKIQEVGSRKTDTARIWKDKGVLGTTLGMLGVALRSLHSTKFGGPNTAMQSLQEQRKQDIQAQMEDRDSELRGLERELGSLDAAVPMLEARMNDALAKRTQALMQDEKSAQALANGKQLVGQLMRERDEKLAEAARAYYGTLSRQEALGASATGSRGFTTEAGSAVAPAEGGEDATSGRFPAIVEGTPEDDSEYNRRGWASTFKPDDPRDRKEIGDYGNGQRQLQKLKATRDKLRSYYGQPNEDGTYTKGDFTSNATGPWWNPSIWNDQRDRELIDAWTAVEQNTRFDWKTEPNGAEMQNRLGQISVPKRDEDVGVKMQSLDKQIVDLERSINGETLARTRAAYKLMTGAPYKANQTGLREPGKIAPPSQPAAN